MPLCHIYLKEGKGAKYLSDIGDGLHQALMETWGIPVKDRFQIYHQKSGGELQIDQSMWGVQRSDDCVVFHIFSSPRTKPMKLAFYERLAAVLEEKVGLKPDDTFISVFTNTMDDWSFGRGRAQLLDAQQSSARGTKRALEAELPVSWPIGLNYGEEAPPGKRVGRYINQADLGDAHDKDKSFKTVMHNARALKDPARLETCGFEMQDWPTAVRDFQNDAEVEHVYYQEIRALVKKASGAHRVLIFDHTIRNSDNTNLNVSKGQDSAAPVLRVHCDYTAKSAERRLMSFAKAGVYSQIRQRKLTEDDIKDLASRRFAFINVWRSIAEEPVEKKPLAMCDTRSVPESDQCLYELIFPDRVGENYSLKFNEAHKWHYYPRMVKDECLVFKVYDKKEDGPRFTFHTAFDDPLTTATSPARMSIEVRTIVFFDDSEVDDSTVISKAARQAVEESSAHD